MPRVIETKIEWFARHGRSYIQKGERFYLRDGASCSVGEPMFTYEPSPAGSLKNLEERRIYYAKKWSIRLFRGFGKILVGGAYRCKTKNSISTFLDLIPRGRYRRSNFIWTVKRYWFPLTIRGAPVSAVPSVNRICYPVTTMPKSDVGGIWTPVSSRPFCWLGSLA